MKNQFTEVIIKHSSTECAHVYFLRHPMITYITINNLDEPNKLLLIGE